MGRVGVLFLLFYLGLESNVTRLIQAGRSIFVGGSIYIGINFTAGLTYGYLTGFSPTEMLVIAGYHNDFFERYRCKDLVRLQANRKPRNRTDPWDHDVRGCVSGSVFITPIRNRLKRGDFVY